ANALLGSPLSEGEIFALGTQIEGHPDNLVPAYLGGLTLVSQAGREVIARKIEIPPMQAAVVVPKISLLTEETRRALPLQVALTEAVQNIGNAALVVEALRTGDVDLLAQVCGDNLHQPYRLPLIPGAQAALEAAQNLGAAAVLSGGGPGVIAFVDDRPEEAAAVMADEFEKAGLESRTFLTDTTNQGAADTII
ncbi:MAG: homoserine kinase, partial [Anaerolineae bacterium]|nr:homoserine kinase [Anaerolineae bacterium]